jgi:archaetidylinositol phosphate synthase
MQKNRTADLTVGHATRSFNEIPLFLRLGSPMDIKGQFKGDTKLPFKSPLAKGERRFIDYCVPRFPRWIEGYHLTLTTILWSAGLIISGHLAQQDLRWLWLSSGMLFMQWFTDSFDGALGRYRDTGIPKWGFYMDHLLDFIFMCSILIGYALLFDGPSRNIFLILVPIFGAFMINSYLSFAATNEFKITFLGMGPTEVRLLVIVLNTMIIIFGTGFVEKVLPMIPLFTMIALAVVVYRTQKYIWQIDMEDKRGREI